MDVKVLDRLFTMFDKTGDDAIYYREFISGIAPLISADVKEKVNFALQVCTFFFLYFVVVKKSNQSSSIAVLQGTLSAH
jgi:hypothetical protein